MGAIIAIVASAVLWIGIYFGVSAAITAYNSPPPPQQQYPVEHYQRLQ